MFFLQYVLVMFSLITLYVLFIVFIASVIRSAFGFGESLIAVPLLALVIPINIAVPLSVLMSITIAAIVVLADWQSINFQSAKRLLISTLFGIPIGLLILKVGNERVIKTTLGIIIILFSVLSLTTKKTFGFKVSNKWSYGCGFLAGILGGAYGMNGPPLIVYGNMRRWTPQQFRATLHAYFLPASALGMIGYWKAGLWTSTVSNYYYLSLIVVLPAIFLGKKLNHILPDHIFKKCIYLSLIAIGLLLIFI